MLEKHKITGKALGLDEVHEDVQILVSESIKYFICELSSKGRYNILLNQLVSTSTQAFLQF